MDMDIFPDELELLEANSHLHDNYLDIPPLDPSLDDEYEQENNDNNIHQTLTSAPASPPSTDTKIDSKKRPRSDDPNFPAEKRSRTDSVEPHDDDWLQYSPPSSSLPPEESVYLEEKIVSRYASEIDGDFIPVTAQNGDRVYAKICSAGTALEANKMDFKGHSGFGGLILEPINVLFHKLEQEAFTKALQASAEGQSDIIVPEAPQMHEELWVDKYAPSSFTELLSDEQTNREVLLWLKQWDSCVFGSEIRSTSDEVLTALRRHSSISQHQRVSDSNYMRKHRESRWSKRSTGNSHDLELENNNPKNIQDLWQRKIRHVGPPEQKILLLCGPPGLGKTTLAHVAANHCGYRVVEINASDDRSSSTIEAKILDVVQMNSVTADCRPKCLVIDEVDGALGEGKGAVDVLLKMVSAERKSDTGREYAAKDERSGKKKRGKTSSLSRPVICICNDLYAPALRALRQVAKVHMFVQPTVSRVVSRLKYICDKEKVKTSSISLTSLAEYTECDIRSCLNTLQFLNKKKEMLNMMEISSQVVGKKDLSRSAFDVWKEIFQKRKMKRGRNSNSSCSSGSSEIDILHSVISSRGDYDLIMDGIHENVLLLQYHDPLMQKTVKCLDNLGDSDMMHRYIMRTQNMSLQVYQPSIAVAVHCQVAQVQKPTIEWPKSYHRHRTMLTEKMEILRSWNHSISPCISRHLSIKSFVEEIASPLLHIVSPATLRPVALHLLTERERHDLTQLVTTMVSYSLTYKNVKSDLQSSKPMPGVSLAASELALDPPINDFINFKDHKSNHNVLASAMKQILVHEVEKERILQTSAGRSVLKENQDYAREKAGCEKVVQRNQEVACAPSKMGNPSDTSIKVQHNSSVSISSSIPGAIRSATDTARLKSMGDKKKPSTRTTNFFDRFRKLSKNSQHDADNDGQIRGTPETVSHPLLFKFNEGFTNAIKRPVRIREFLVDGS